MKDNLNTNIKNNIINEYQTNIINNFVDEYSSSTTIIVNNLMKMDNISAMNTIDKLRVLNIQMDRLLIDIKDLESNTIRNKIRNNLIDLSDEEKNIIRNNNTVNKMIKDVMPQLIINSFIER